MKKLKKSIFALTFAFTIMSCSNSDVVVQIYGAYEYNCTTDEYRVLSENSMVPFMKAKKWYTKEEFHEAHVEDSLKPYEGLAISEDGLLEIAPSREMSYDILQEIINEVDCDNPQDIMLL
tara:strand:- start:241 stop:600 length:360 start_codon:yes stop_codon:yes gene_type:complete